MKNIIILIVTLLFGLALGYLLFGRKPAKMETPATTENHDHDNEIWTCSMHPQIRQDEPGICPICEMDLIPLASNASDDPLVLTMTESAAHLAEIQTTLIGDQTTKGKEAFLELTGTIRADERRAATLAAHVPGRIEQLYVTFVGESVRKGQALARIYSPQLVTAQQELIEARKLADTQPALLEAARSKLRNWRMSDAFIEKLEQNGELQNTITVHAESSGVVTEKRVEVGDYVGQGEALFVLTDLSRLWIQVDAFEEDLGRIKKGTGLTFTTPALPGKEFKATINFIDPVINPATRTAGLRAEVRNANGQLKPAMLIRAKLGLSATAQQDNLQVPKTAVLWTGPRSVVYVSLPDADIPSYEFREVSLGEAVGKSYQVLDGLTAGDRVVTNGAFVIDAAAQLNNQMSMMNRDVQIGTEKMDMTAVEVPDYQAAASAELQAHISHLAKAYLALKDGLVLSDVEATSASAQKLITSLNKTPASLPTDEALLYWEQQQQAMLAHTKNIAASKDLEEQRKQFEFLSIAMINAVQAFGSTDGTLYVQYCPMAFDNQGANWLAAEEKINNPYFGDKMLRCGSVEAVLE